MHYRVLIVRARREGQGTSVKETTQRHWARGTGVQSRAAPAAARDTARPIWDTRRVDGVLDGPEELPKASFTGGIRERPGGFGVSWPFGHLEFDRDRLRIWGIGDGVDVRRDEVRGVRLSTGILATRVSVVYPDGSESQVYFAALIRRPVRKALRRLRWTVLEGRRAR